MVRVMTDQILVGVDCGTTSIKALAVSLSGVVLGQASRPTLWRHDGPNTDIDATLLSDTAIAVCAEAALSVGHPVQVVGVGVTSFAEAGVLLDAHGVPCAPTLAWFDPRGDAGPIKDIVTRRDFQRATGRRLNSKPSLAKILYLRKNFPSAHEAVRHLCVAEWVVHAMGGEQVAEASLSARTGLMELATRGSYPVAVELVGDLLPSQGVWAGDPAGVSGGDIPAVLRGAVLSVAGLDHQAAMLVLGAARRGALLNSLGTAEALIRTVEPVSADQVEQMTDADIAVDWSVVPDHQVLLAGHLTGLTLERISSMLGLSDREARRRIGEAALAVVRDANSPRLVDVSNDSVTLAGITDGISPEVVWRSVVEDLTDIAGGSLNLMEQVVGAATSTVLVGGWSRNPMVADAKRRQLGEYTTSDLQEPGALGAAFMAGIAAGVLQRPAPDGFPAWQE